jgi:3-isopropylmalate dehydrogenase
VLKVTDGLFREACFDVAKDFPGLQADEMLVDAMAMRLVRDPERFDVIVTTNLFGDILSDETAGLIGGLGIAPSGNVGGTTPVFEPVHGSAPDIAGKGVANPIACIMSFAMALRYSFDLPDEAAVVEKAVTRVLEQGLRTGDIMQAGKTKAGTREMGEAVLKALEKSGA